jgi:hypothetical protein
MCWRDNPKRVRAVELLDIAQECERQAQRLSDEHIQKLVLIARGAEFRAQSRTLAAEANRTGESRW